MKNARIVYGIVVGLVFIGYIYTTYFYFLMLFIMSSVFPFIVRLLLQIEISYIQIDFEGSTSSKVGKNIIISSIIKSIHRLLISGTIEYQLVYENTSIKCQKRKQYNTSLDVEQTVETYQHPATLCGNVCFYLEDIYLYDVFKLCRVPIQCNKKHHLVVYPQEVNLEINHEVSSQPRQNGVLQFLYDKGNDISEIFDLKEYVPGDDIRHMHWKLSAKAGHMLMKEGTRYSSYETVLLVDIGCFDSNTRLDEETLSSAIAYAMALSEQLLLKHIGHLVLFYNQGAFYPMEMNHVQEYYQQLEQWLSKSVSDQGGQGLHLFISEQLDLIFSKMLYVTAGQFSKEISQLYEHLSMSAFTFRKTLKHVNALKHNSVQLYELPVEDLEKQELHFDL